MDAKDNAVLDCLRTMDRDGHRTATVEEISIDLEMGAGSVESSLDVLENLGYVRWINGEQAVEFLPALTEDDDDCPEIGDGMTDAEADADTFRSCGWGTDEDYGYFGGDE